MKGAKLINQEKIGHFISELRKARNMTQEELAEKLNVNVKTISRWENGKNMSEHTLIIEICKLFGISTNEFYNGNKIKKAKKIRKIIIFYLIVSFTGIFILPFLAIASPTLIICAILIPIAALMDLIALVFTKSDIPQILFQVGNTKLHPALALLISILISIFLFIIDIYSWKLLIKYIRIVSNKNKKIYNEL